MSDLVTGIREAFKTFGSTDAQAEDAAVVLADKCAMVSGVVTMVETGKPLADSKDWIEQHKPHWLPAKFERSLADRAFVDGNVTARGTLLKQVGEAEATRIAQSYGLKSLHDTRRGTRPADAANSETKRATDQNKNNPWSRDNWNVTKQGQLIKALGVEKASAIARAVNSRIGATRPAAA